MKRWLLISALILAALVLVTPGIIGRMIEQLLADNLALARVELPQLTVTSQQFQRQWLSSEGHHRVEFSDRNAFPELARFVGSAGYRGMPALHLRSHIDHGLVPLSSIMRANGSLKPGLASLVISLQMDPGNGELIDPPVHIYSTVGLGGGTHSTLFLEPGSWSAAGTSLRWQNARVQASLDAAGLLTGIQASVDPFLFSTAGLKIESGHIDIVGERYPGPFNLQLGSLKIESGGLAIVDATGTEQRYASMNMAIENGINANFLHGQGALEIVDVSLPGAGVISLGLNANYSEFDADAFVRLRSAIQTASINKLPSSTWEDLYPLVELELKQFLSAGANIQLERFDVSLQQGDIALNLKLSLPASATTAGFSWRGLLMSLKMTMNLQMSVDVFERLVAMQADLKMAVAMGFLVRNGNDYLMQVDYKQGMAVINGQPLLNVVSLLPVAN